MDNKKANVLTKAKKIKVIATDVDGVLTDGHLFINEKEYEPFGRFSIIDGFGIVIAHDCDLKIVVISGRKSLSTEARCKSLGIDETYTGILDKAAKLKEVADRLKVKLPECAYIGDDLIDLKAMKLAGFSVAPKNAVEFVRQRVDYVTKAKGGDGALRELIELVLKAQGRYAKYVQQYL